MKYCNISSLLGSALILLGNQAVISQGFVNLDFEDAVIVLDPQLPYHPNSTYPTSAVPNWTLYGNFGGMDFMFYNTVSLGVAAISIHDWNSFETPLQGDYSLVLQPESVTLAPVAIGQTAQLPSDAQLVTFYGESSYTVLTFAGNPISLTVFGTTPNYTIYGGDISAFAGQTGELRIQGVGRIDNIEFLVPEPTALSLFGFGLLGLCWHGRCGKQA